MKQLYTKKQLLAFGFTKKDLKQGLLKPTHIIAGQKQTYYSKDSVDKFLTQHPDIKGRLTDRMIELGNFALSLVMKAFNCESNGINDNGGLCRFKYTCQYADGCTRTNTIMHMYASEPFYTLNVFDNHYTNDTHKWYNEYDWGPNKHKWGQIEDIEGISFTYLCNEVHMDKNKFDQYLLDAEDEDDAKVRAYYILTRLQQVVEGDEFKTALEKRRRLAKMEYIAKHAKKTQ